MAEVDTKERIKQQAHKLVFQYGIRSVSMDDIANSLGISKKTIYHFYSDKDELIDAIVVDIINNSELICNRDSYEAENAIHEMFLAKQYSADLMKSMNPSLLYDLQKYHPAVYVKFQRYRTDFLYNMVRQNIIRGIAEELYRDDIKVDLVARLRVESMLIPFNPEFQVNTKYSLLEAQEELMELYLFSVVNPKGYKMIVKYKQELEKKTNGHGTTKSK